MKIFTFSMAAIPLLWCAAAVHRPVAATEPADVAAGWRISVVTLNMAKETDAARIVGELRANPMLRDADVLLLQEVKDGAATDVAEAFGLRVEQGNELAILSRYPIADTSMLRLPVYGLGFHSRRRFALGATVMTPAGPLRVFDTHLDTRLNAGDRLAQIAPVVDAAGAGAVLIGGDFNSNGFYWLAHVAPLPALRSQAERVWRYMGGSGFTSTIAPWVGTFDYLGMHLDWIWGRGVKVGPTQVYPLRFSDHHAVRTVIGL
jgi:endonuclease/exonuclease/phosphatase family metal-dependent hydrolase